jgi:two-component system chemotaxis response regulator CheB
MPENAIREVAVDHIVPVAEMPKLLVTTLNQKSKVPVVRPATDADSESRQLKVEIDIAAEDAALQIGIMNFGELTPYTCPDCHGVLSEFIDGRMRRFRCHTGHAFTADSLLATVTENIENSLWSAIRGVDESIILLNHMGDHFAEINEPRLAAVYFRKAKDAQKRNDVIRQVVFSHEQLSADSLRHEDASSNGEAEAEHEMPAFADR